MRGENAGPESTPLAPSGGLVLDAADVDAVADLVDEPTYARRPVVDRFRSALTSASDHAWMVTAVLATVVAFIGIRGGDFPAQDYRVWVFKTHGFLIWDVNWYGGHSDVGYSVLFPVVGAVLGTVPAIALACIASTVLFGQLVGRSSSWACVVSRLWFAVFIVGDLIIGRAPFACSLACALAAVLFVRRRSRWLALAAAVATSLFSPLGAVFLLLIAAGWAPSLGWRRAWPFAGALTGLAVAALAGEGGGRFPFPWTALTGPLLIVAIGLVVTPRYERTVLRVLALYGAACLVLFFVPNPVGGNMARLAGVVIGPVAAWVLLRDNRARALALLAAPLLAFQVQPVITSVVSAAGDISDQPGYYHGVTRFLAEHQDPVGKVEIPFTEDHWEATYVAEKVPLARGWDRQIDLSRNAVLYKPMTPDQYDAWLHDNAVSYVALPDVDLDEGGQAEAAILRNPPSWLKQVYADEHWKVWKVVDPTPLATGAATMTALAHNGFVLAATSVGATTVRLRWSPYWQVDDGAACLAEGPGGWTTVVSLEPGTATISAGLSLGDDDACTPEQLAVAGAPKRG